MGHDRAEYNQVVTMIGSSLVGTLCGLVAVAFGSLISGSPAAIAATVLAGGVFGAWAGRVPGAIVGAIGGVLATAFGSVISGTPAGMTLTIAGCALLAGWARWFQERSDGLHVAQ